MIVQLIHEMDRTAGDVIASLKDRLVYVSAIHALPPVSREECWMDVDDLPVPLWIQAKFFEIATEADEIRILLIDELLKIGVIVLWIWDGDRKPDLTGPFDAGDIFTGGDHLKDLCREFVACNGLMQIQHRSATAADQRDNSESRRHDG